MEQVTQPGQPAVDGVASGRAGGVAAAGGAPAPVGSTLALRRCLVLWRLAWRATALSLWLTVVRSVLHIGFGVRLVPGAVRATRALADRERELAAQWSGVQIPTRYAPLGPARSEAVALRARLLAADDQVWRDWRWVQIEPLVGGSIVFLPLSLLLTGVWGLLVAAFGTQLSAEWGSLWFLFVPVDSWFTAALAGVLALAMFPLALWLAPHALRWHARCLRTALAAKESELLAARIEHLTATRSDALETQLAEVRRIERDLHDGAQARRVAMGMTLDAAERRLGSDPEAVRALLTEARESSSKALAELRDLVRGIHPPVLADRGLGDAVRSLAMLSPLTTEVRVDLPARPAPPVESAAYFAVSEVLTNAVKHAGAQRAWIDVRYEHGALHVDVTDDGRGGADLARGTGLRGIERRLAAFDGVLAVSSPPGGPTIVTMELPCALFWPKTTSS
ncbi:histidine kinase [Streptomyces sp. HSW2009]|uniref:sensor histidine kinase n=1 Tax=Streptomyces sp. HSW2009 TaxID=3142890 RepID=UPI0032EB4124